MGGPESSEGSWGTDLFRSSMASTAVLMSQKDRKADPLRGVPVDAGGEE